MIILEKAITPDGIEIQLENWDDGFANGLAIGAYPVARANSENGWIQCGNKFRLTIPNNKYLNYTNGDVKNDFENLKTGRKSIAVLSEYFWNGEKDRRLLGI